MFHTRDQVHLYICLFHRQFQALGSRGRGTDVSVQKRAPEYLRTRVRECPHFPMMNGTKMLGSHRGLLDRHRARLNVVGRMDMFPPEVQAAMAKAKELTSDNRRCVRYCKCRH